MKTKYNFIIILLTLFILSSCNKSVNYNLEQEYFKEEQGILYYKGTPFSGEIFNLYPNEIIKEKGEFVDGKSKIWEWYNKDGSFLLQGKKVVVENVIQLEKYVEINFKTTLFIKDLKTGVPFTGIIKFNEEEEWIISNGLVIKRTEFSKNGNIEVVIELLNNNLFNKTEYHDNKNIKSIGNLILRKNDVYLRDGKWIEYYYDGNVKKITYYKNNKKEGKYTYFENENIRLEGTHKNDLRFGDWIVYDENGKVSQTLSYNENGVYMEPVFELVEKEGVKIWGGFPEYKLRTNLGNISSGFEIRIPFKNVGLKDLKIDSVQRVKYRTQEYELFKILLLDSNRVIKSNRTGYIKLKLKPNNNWVGKQSRKRKIEIHTNMEENKVITIECILEFYL